MIETLFTGIALAVCVALMVRLCLGARRRQRFDDMVQRAMQGCRTTALRIYRWRSSRRDAASLAEEAINRARDGVQREGNVYRPQSFKGPRKPH